MAVKLNDSGDGLRLLDKLGFLDLGHDLGLHEKLGVRECVGAVGACRLLEGQGLGFRRGRDTKNPRPGRAGTIISEL